MLVRAMTAVAVGGTLLIAATSAAAQERGTIEFGVFGSAAAYDDDIDINNGWGGGARVGAFLFPWLSAEFDVGYRTADRPLGLVTAEVEAFAARLTAVPLVMGPLSLLVGGGVIHTDYQLDESDGYQGLLGARLAVTPSVAIRLDGLADFNRNDSRNQTLQLGVSYFRHPGILTRTVTVPGAPGPAATAPMAQRPDSVSAAETRRLRGLEADLRALRDSLATAGPMSDLIYFAHDVSTLSDAAKSILDGKVALFRGDPAMRIAITGHASRPGTDAYNLALGLRRAEAARDYLVTRGVDRARIDIASNGSGGLVAQGSGEPADAANRRAEFRLFVGELD